MRSTKNGPSTPGASNEEKLANAFKARRENRYAGSGNVRVRLSGEPSFDLDAHTSSGSIAFFPDNEPQHGHRPPVNAPAELGTRAMKYAREEDLKMVEFLRGTDVLIMDSQYDRNEYKSHVGWGHGCVDDVVSLAIEAEVKKLFLFHHDPDHDDATITRMVAHARRLAKKRKSRLIIEAAREGAKVKLSGGKRKSPARRRTVQLTRG